MAFVSGLGGAAAAGSAAGGKGGLSLGTALAIGGTAFAVGRALQTGAAESSAAEMQAGILREQAAQEQRLAAQRERDFRREQSRLMARRRAALGASGVEAGSGSPLLIAEDFAAETERQARRIREGGEIRATRLAQQSELFRDQARSARTGAFLGAGTALLSGGFRVARTIDPRLARIT